MLDILLSRVASKPSVPVMIESNPGSGKTALVERWAKRHNYPLVKMLSSTMDETDIAGIIVYDKERDSARTVSPDWYHSLKPDNGYGGRGVLFMDEFNCCRREVQDTLLSLVCSRHLPNGDRLGDGVMIVAAQNDAKQCDNYELSPAMRTRFMWVKHVMTPTQWYSWFSGGTEDSVVRSLPDYQTIESWTEWLHADPSHDADKKALLSAAIKNGLKFDSDKAMVDKPLPTTARGLMNLAYWCNSALEMIQFSEGFIDAEATAILRSVDTKAYMTVGNQIFRNRKKTDTGDANELQKVRQQSAVHSKIARAANLG